MSNREVMEENMKLRKSTREQWAANPNIRRQPVSVVAPIDIEAEELFNKVNLLEKELLENPVEDQALTGE